MIKALNVHDNLSKKKLINVINNFFVCFNALIYSLNLSQQLAGKKKKTNSMSYL